MSTIGIEQVRNRLKVLESRAGPVQAELDSLNGQEETPALVARHNELAQAMMVMVGRRMECEAWIELMEAYPGVTRPDQLPTKANTPAYVPLTETTSPAAFTRRREANNRKDSDDLAALLPDAE